MELKKDFEFIKILSICKTETLRVVSNKFKCDFLSNNENAFLFGNLTKELKDHLAKEHIHFEYVDDFHAKFFLASRTFQKEDSIIKVKGVKIGGDGKPPIIAGPCAVDSREVYLASAVKLKELGADVLRGGIFKPRSSPHSFQGLRDKGLDVLLEAKNLTGLPICTEITEKGQLEMVEHIDIVQIGTRNSQNIELLKALGRMEKPVLLKRGFGCTISEWLGAAEFILNEGNPNVILCERGIRTFEGLARFTLDINAVPIIKELSHLPIIVDPSHAAGNRKWVPALSKSAIGAGANGLEIEVHPNPEQSITDAEQAITPEVFKRLTGELNSIYEVLSKDKIYT